MKPKTPYERTKDELCLPWYIDEDGMLCGKNMEVIAGLTENENGEQKPAVYRDFMREFILLAANTFFSRTEIIQKLSEEIKLRCQYESFLSCCVRSGEWTEMTFEEFCEKEEDRRKSPSIRE